MKKIALALLALISVSAYSYEGQPRKVAFYTSIANKVIGDIDNIDLESLTLIDNTCYSTRNEEMIVGNVKYTFKRFRLNNIFYGDKDCLRARPYSLIFSDEESGQEIELNGVHDGSNLNYTFDDNSFMPAYMIEKH